MIAKEREQIKEHQEGIGQIQKINQGLLEEYSLRTHNHQLIVHHIKNTLTTKAHLDHKFLAADMLTHQQVLQDTLRRSQDEFIKFDNQSFSHKQDQN